MSKACLSHYLNCLITSGGSKVLYSQLGKFDPNQQFWLIRQIRQMEITGVQA